MGALWKTCSYRVGTLILPCGGAGAPVLSTSWLQSYIAFLDTQPHIWPLAPKKTTWPGQEGLAASDTWETRTSLLRISQTPVLSQLILSDPPSPLSGIVGQVFGVFSAQWAIPVSKTNTERGGFLVPMQIYPPKPQRSALQAKKSTRGLWQATAIPVTLPQDHRGHLALFGE